MAKLVASINMTLDGYCDHTAMNADEELHQHYTDLLNDSGALIYGRTTYQLMEDFWPSLIKTPTGDKSLDDFALAIENIPKIVFSRTLNSVGWKNVRLAKRSLKDEVLEMKQKPGKDILVGSPGLISALTQLNLFDEYQLCVHPVILGNGLTLFRNVSEKRALKLLKTKTFGSGAILGYYELTKSS